MVSHLHTGTGGAAAAFCSVKVGLVPIRVHLIYTQSNVFLSLFKRLSSTFWTRLQDGVGNPLVSFQNAPINTPTMRMMIATTIPAIVQPGRAPLESRKKAAQN
jgi:hypothetical protein